MAEAENYKTIVIQRGYYTSDVSFSYPNIICKKLFSLYKLDDVYETYLNILCMFR